MAKSVEDLPKEMQRYIDVRKWDMRTLEGNRRFLELKGRSLPAIALEGELVYESLIPGQDDLVAEIIRYWEVKNRNIGKLQD